MLAKQVLEPSLQAGIQDFGMGRVLEPNLMSPVRMTKTSPLYNQQN
jgi:hypothetical protein